MNNMWILADATEAANNEADIVTMEDAATEGEQATTQQPDDMPPTETNERPGFLDSPMMFIMLPLLLVYMFFMFRGPKKKQQEHNKMVSSLAKNDRVRTIGGIFGTVLDVRDNEIVLKIDESTNTKMRVSPQAIATVLTDKTE